MHSTFWENMAPAGKGGGGQPGGALADALNKEFGSFEPVQERIYESRGDNGRFRMGCLSCSPVRREAADYAD